MDLISFTMDIYTTNLVKKYDSEDNKSSNVKKDDELDPQFYNLFLLFLKRYPLKQVHSKELIKELGNTLEVYKQVHSLIFISKHLHNQPQLKM